MVDRLAFAGMDANSAQEMWEKLDALMAQVAVAEEPYWPAKEVLGCVVDAVVDSPTAARICRLWADLTDRYELRPHERHDADAQMRLTATEWSAIKGDDEACEAYLDRWSNGGRRLDPG
jgi:hypothetical protein